MNHTARSSSASAARRIARDVAAAHAADVDARGRLPLEAIAALRDAGLLGAAAPAALGGQGAPMRDVVAACFELGQACSSTGMVYAMHQIQVACLVMHAGAGSWHEDFLRRAATQGLLLASGTTEGSFGGDVRQSDCAVAQADGMVRLVKEGCVISYAGAADAVLITARRGPDTPTNDQVMLVAERAQLDLLETGGWDTLGMRGTDSRSYRLAACCAPGQVLAALYAAISAETMLPVSHLVWAGLWTGIATDACTRARAAVRDRARRMGAGTPSGAHRLAEALTLLQALRAHLADSMRRYEEALYDPERLGSIAFGLSMNALKTGASTMAVQVVFQAMQAIGLAGYRNDSPYSVARHLRDVHSAVLMIGNDRIMANNAAMMTAYRGEEPLFP